MNQSKYFVTYYNSNLECDSVEEVYAESIMDAIDIFESNTGFEVLSVSKAENEE
jgi:hypothetical protein